MRGGHGGATVGTLIKPAAAFSQSSHIGDSIGLLAGAIVEHDCGIVVDARVRPASCSGGDDGIGEGTLLDLGIRVVASGQIGWWCIAGAGAVVIPDLGDLHKVAGVSARPLR